MSASSAQVLGAEFWRDASAGARLDAVLALAEYLVVDGYAVGVYAEPRFTKDLDVWIGDVPDNLARVKRALAAFGAPSELLPSRRSGVASAQRRSHHPALKQASGRPQDLADVAALLRARS